jgi:hypothetical protein
LSPSINELHKFLITFPANILFGGITPMGMGRYGGKLGPGTGLKAFEQKVTQKMVKKLEQSAAVAAEQKTAPRFKLKPEPGGFYSQLERSIKSDSKILRIAEKTGGKLPAAKLLSLLKKSGVTDRELKVTGVGKDLKQLGMAAIDPKLFENRGMTMHAVKTTELHQLSVYKPFVGDIDSAYITSPSMPEYRKTSLKGIFGDEVKLQKEIDALERKAVTTGVPMDPDIEDSLYARMHALQDRKTGVIRAHPYEYLQNFYDPESPDKLSWYYSNVRPLRESESTFFSSKEPQKSEKTTHLPGATGTVTENWRGKQIGTGYNLVEVQSDIRDWMTKSGQSPWDNEEARKMALTSYLNEAVKKAEAGEITHITIPSPGMITNRWPQMDEKKAETIYKGALKYIEKITGQKASVVKVDTEYTQGLDDGPEMMNEEGNPLIYDSSGAFSSETWGIEMTPDVIESIKGKPQKIGLSDFYRQVAFG